MSANLPYLINTKFHFPLNQYKVREQPDYVAPRLPASFNHTIWKELPSAGAPMPTFPSGNEVVTEMNNIYGLHSWFMHGGDIAAQTKADSFNTSPRWCVNTVDAIDNGEVEAGNGLDNLTNEKYPSIIYTIGCTQTPYDDYNPCNHFPGRNMGEGFTCLTKAGGPAFLGNTRNGWVGSSYQLYQKFADLIRIADYDPETGKSYLHLGVAELISKQNYNSHYLRYSHNLVGCPETKIWTNTPSLFTNVSVADGGNYVTVNPGVSDVIINVRSVNNGLSYDYTAYDVSNYTFNTTIRPLIVTITKTGYLPYSAITGGTLNIDGTLFGKIDVLSNLSIANGRTLTINPGAILNFKSNYSEAPSVASLYVYGTLNAQGTEEEKIVFDRIGSSGNWGSIIFDGSSSSNSIIDNAVIKNGIEIRCLNSADVTIQNSKIENCSQGIYIYNSAPEIINNNIIEPYGNGIYGEASGKSPLIKGNKIKKTSGNPQYHHYQGIYLYGSTNPFITENDIQGFDFGIYYGGGGSGSLTDNYFNTPSINNRFANNMYGMTVAWGSYLVAGMEPADERSETIGCNNSIYGNNSYDAYAYQNATILAQRNWWGSDGAQILTATGGYIDASHPRTSDPWSGIPLKTSNHNVSNQYYEKDSINISDIIAGIRLEADGNINGAIGHYKNMLRGLSSPKFALSRLASIKNRFSINSIQNYLVNQLTTNQNYKAALLNIVAGMYLDDGRYEEAMQLYSLIISGYPNSYDATNALFEKFFAAFNYANDLTLASQLLSQLQSLNITDEDFLMRLEVAEFMLNGTLSNKLSKDGIDNSNVNEFNMPKEYCLLGNYPNPFNPSTTISYALPYQSSVELVIYDIMGAEVRSFNIPSQSAGYQNILWDGTNENGNSVSSGIYLYRISIKSLENNGTFMKTAKLMMLK